MGIPHYLLPASVNAIMAQRLVRRLCKHCNKPISFDALDDKMKVMVKKAIDRTSKDELLNRVGAEKLKNACFYEPVGCDHCNQTGYSGRVGIYEVMEITPRVKEMIAAGAPSIQINDVAIADGMISLEQDGIIKALNGATSLAEVYAAAKENA
jgi:type II secretory ATPase GspE/PulE/Tfp pilus assembly ATPase PilB-like protein